MPGLTRIALILASLITSAACAQTIPHPPFDSSGWFPFNPRPSGGATVIGLADWLDRPAGEHGAVLMQGSRLRFDDGTPIKFWGVNIYSKNAYPTAERAERWADHLAFHGVNAVRFHKFTEHGITGGTSTVIDPARLARFDYFQHQLRQRGIYYGWSPIYGHRLRRSDRGRLLAYDEIVDLQFPWYHLNASTSGLVNFAADLQSLNIELLVNMLNQRNPHTGLRYADDPALAFVELQNEDNIFWSAIGKALEQAPTYRRLLHRQFSDWLLQQYGSESAWRQAWGSSAIPWGQSLSRGTVDPTPNHGLFTRAYQAAENHQQAMARPWLDKLRFLHHKQTEFYRRFARAIRATGYRGLIVSSGWRAGSGPSHYYNLHADYLTGPIDRHSYFGGGTGHRLEPGPVHRQAMVEQPGSGLLGTGLQQVADRPFILSEWMSILPKRWTAEAAPQVALYGMGMQGWDGSFQFASTHPGFAPTLHAPNVYNVESPAQLGLYPALSRLVLRDDIAEGDVVSTRYIHLPSLDNRRLGFLELEQPIGSSVTMSSSVAPPAILAAGRAVVEFSDRWRPSAASDWGVLRDEARQTIRSSTGELVWHYGAQPMVQADTAASKALLGFSGGRRVQFTDWALQIDNPFAVVLLTALEADATIADSRELLLVTIGQQANSGLEYSADADYLQTPGHGPILLEPVSLDLQADGRSAFRLFPLTHAGELTDRSQLFVDGSSIRVDGAVHRTMYYLLRRE